MGCAGRYGTRYRALRYWNRFGVFRSAWLAMDRDVRGPLVLVVILALLLVRHLVGR